MIGIGAFLFCNTLTDAQSLFESIESIEDDAFSSQAVYDFYIPSDQRLKILSFQFPANPFLPVLTQPPKIFA